MPSFSTVDRSDLHLIARAIDTLPIITPRRLTLRRVRRHGSHGILMLQGRVGDGLSTKQGDIITDHIVILKPVRRTFLELDWEPVNEY